MKGDNRHSWFNWLLCLTILSSLGQHSFAAEKPAAVEVGITTHLGDQQTFVEDDVISFLLSLDRDAYVYLFYQDASNNILQIFPNQQGGKHFYNKGVFMPVPPSQTDFEFKIQPPFGEENLLVFATDNADINLGGRILENGLYLIDGPAGNLEFNIRQQSRSQFGYASMVIVSRPR